MVQYLKSIYKPNFKALGAWGIPVLDGGKISYPANVKERMQIFNNVYGHYMNLPPADNKLIVYVTTNKIELDKLKANTDKAAVQNAFFETTAAQALAETEARDLLMNPVAAHLKLIGDKPDEAIRRKPTPGGALGISCGQEHGEAQG